MQSMPMKRRLQTVGDYSLSPNSTEETAALVNPSHGFSRLRFHGAKSKDDEPTQAKRLPAMIVSFASN